MYFAREWLCSQRKTRACQQICPSRKRSWLWTAYQSTLKRLWSYFKLYSLDIKFQQCLKHVLFRVLCGKRCWRRSKTCWMKPSTTAQTQGSRYKLWTVLMSAWFLYLYEVMVSTHSDATEICPWGLTCQGTYFQSLKFHCCDCDNWTRKWFMNTS